MIGKTLAHYDVTEQLGAGGMGEVYRARDTKLGRDVALKILPESFAADSDRLARFEREAKLLAGLNHTNIAAIYGIEQADAQRFLVLELVEGVDLAKRLAEGPLIVDDALAVAYQISLALEAAHEQGVVHRDLKPANVVVSPSGTVKVLDFGLAKASEADADYGELSHSPTLLASSPTVQGVILGTAAYMSPEQARGKTVDRRADIWSFGVVLFEMLTGRQLFNGETVSDMLASVIKSEPNWDALPKTTPRAIVHLLERCLDKDPRTRLRDIGEARVVIDRVLRGEIEDGPDAGVAPVSSRYRIGWAAITVLVAVVVAAVAWGTRPGSPEPPLRKFNVAIESQDGARPADPAISPDGRMVAYVLEGGLFVRELDELAPREIPVVGNASTPYWSPDGRYIGYISGDDIWKVPMSGGTSTKICEPTGSFTTGRGLVWSPDDRIIFSQGNGPVFEVSANGGDPHVLVDLLEGESDLHEPSLLPDDKGMLVVSHRTNDSPDRIELIAGGERRLLVHVDGVRLGFPTYSRSGHVLFTRSGTNAGVWAVPLELSSLEVTGEPFPVAADAGHLSVSDDGTLVYLRGGTGEAVQMVWVDRDGTLSDPITDEAPNQFDPALSPDGKRLALCEWDGTQVNIWIHDLRRRTRTRFTFGEGNRVSPEWAADGLHVFYGDTRSDTIMMRKADGTGSRTPITRGRMPSLSRDGTHVVYYVQGGDTQEDIWYLELGGQAEPKPLLVTPAREYRPRISPDGNYIAYASNESGEFEVYITRFPTSEGKWQVSTNGGDRPRWSRDGKSLYYQEEHCSLMEVPVTLNPSPVLGAPTKVIDCEELGLSEGFGREYEVDVDGSRFLWSRSVSPGQGRIDVGITLVENWAKEFSEK